MTDRDSYAGPRSPIPITQTARVTVRSPALHVCPRVSHVGICKINLERPHAVRQLLSLIFFVVVTSRLGVAQDLSFRLVSPAEETAPQVENDYLYEQLAATADAIANNSDDQVLSTPVQVEAGWWQPLVSRSIRRDADAVPLGLEEVLYEALSNSEQIRVFRQLPPIRQTAIIEADSAFDWHAFLDSQWDDFSDPIGSTLTAGPGINRFRDHNLTGSMGARKRTRTGGQLELAQQLGWRDNNSQFFQPAPQGTSRIALNFTQPLLRGRGRAYNNSLICLAQIDHNVAHDELMRQLQAHLLEVSRAYWAIYLERGVLYQKLRTYDRAKQIVERLRLRKNIDAPQAQIQAAEATLADRQSDLARALTAVKNAEARIRALVNSPRYGEFETLELIPVDPPSFDIIPVNLDLAVAEAISSHPEIQQSLRQIKASSIRLGMSRHELMPVLNLVTSAYVAGLAGQGDIAEAWRSQFNQGEPGYSVGLQFELPLGNRAAHARKDRRHRELKQSQHRYRVVMNTVMLEVKIAVREIETAQKELFSKQQVVAARETQLNHSVARWERLPGQDATTNLMLTNILSAQEDLARAEFEYLQAQITYNLSRINLRKATGSLLMHQTVNVNPIPIAQQDPIAEDDTVEFRVADTQQL